MARYGQESEIPSWSNQGKGVRLGNRIMFDAWGEELAWRRETQQRKGWVIEDDGCWMMARVMVGRIMRRKGNKRLMWRCEGEGMLKRRVKRYRSEENGTLQ